MDFRAALDVLGLIRAVTTAGAAAVPTLEVVGGRVDEEAIFNVVVGRLGILSLIGGIGLPARRKYLNRSQRQREHRSLSPRRDPSGNACFIAWRTGPNPLPYEQGRDIKHGVNYF